MTDTTITIIGGGLIGGSICLSIKRRRPFWKVVCLDLPERLPAIIEANIADDTGTFEDAAEHLPHSKLVVLATPVKVIIDHLGEIAPLVREGTIVTDVGSTKVQIMERARKTLPAGVSFIGGHPIAGSEASGVDAADPLLFKDRAYVLCPYSDTPSDALLFLVDLVEDLLAQPVTIEPEEHDRIMAMISHVPQLLAVALVNAAMEDDATHEMLDLIAGRGFLDLTRIAASDHHLWQGIIETNKPAINAALNRLEQNIARVRVSIEEGDLASAWAPASQRRRRIGFCRLPRMRMPELRQQIDACDEEILKALANRLRIVSRIGKLKKNRNAPVLDIDRERRMINARQVWARTLDLPSELVESLFDVIIGHSRKQQSQLSDS